MGENRDSEGQDVGEEFDRETTELGELTGDLGEGRRSFREPLGGRCIEHHDGKATGADDYARDGYEVVELVARDDDRRRLHLEDEPGEREAKGASPMRGKLSDTADFPGIEGGVPDHIPLGEEDERPWVTAGRKSFEHIGSGVSIGGRGPTGLDELPDDAGEAGAAAPGDPVGGDPKRSTKRFFEERFGMDLCELLEAGDASQIIEPLRDHPGETFDSFWFPRTLSER